MGPHFFKCGKQCSKVSGKVKFSSSMGPHFFKCGKEHGLEKQTRWHSSLQWGRTFSSAERSVGLTRMALPPLFFNGAALFQVRKVGAPLLARLRVIFLQWGRTFSSAESRSKRSKRRRLGRSSMGPHFFKCGKHSQAHRTCQAHVVFNGAALFQVRKVSGPTPTTARGTRSSMGPHFFKCGKMRTGLLNTYNTHVFNGAALFQVRKVLLLLLLLLLLFNGAALFQVRKEIQTSLDCLLGLRLQWGRTFSSAESKPIRQLVTPLSSSSMGPHFFKCGKSSIPPRINGHNWSSMGPHFFKCGKRKSSCSPLRRSKFFNGAALFQVRKAPYTSGERIKLSVFNGAALFQVRKD